MKNESLIAAAAVLVLSNAALLLHALDNRRGTPDADITLTQRELLYAGVSPDEDDSGVTLRLEWADPFNLPWPEPLTPPVWLDRPLLVKLGFDCSVDPSAPGANRHYQRQRPRQGYVALEFEGPAWRSWLENYQRVYDESAPRKPNHAPLEDALYRTHLLAIDADADPHALRSRHPDRNSVIVLPAVIDIVLQTLLIPGSGPVNRYRTLPVGRIEQVPTEIHVPRPFSDPFRGIDRTQAGYRQSARYRVHLRYGSLFEPWVAGVEIR